MGRQRRLGLLTGFVGFDLRAYLNTIQSLNLPLVIGETGSAIDKADESWEMGGSWNAVHTLFRVLPKRSVKVGVLHWFGSAGGLGGPLFEEGGSWFEYPERALSWQGKELLNYAMLVRQ